MKTNRENSTCAKLSTRTELSICEANIHETELLRHINPSASIEGSGQHEDCKEMEKPIPKAQNVNMSRPDCPKLWSNRNKSKLLEPNAKVEESKDESPNNNTKRPGCDKLRRDIKNSGDVESKANIAEPTSPSE